MLIAAEWIKILKSYRENGIKKEALIK